MTLRLLRPVLILLTGILLSGIGCAQSSPFLSSIRQVTPNNRVNLLLNYFDTCQAVIRRKAYADQLLSKTDSLARTLGDDQLRRYIQLVRDTQAKHSDLSNADKAVLFRRVGNVAQDNGQPDIVAVCQHFAGQYYFLGEDYGRAFEYLIAANQGFKAIGYDQVPGISRYLYELAFNYYYFQEFDKAIALLQETTRYTPYNENLAIQTYNTLALSYANQHYVKTNLAASDRAEQSFRQARRVAASYGDSLWVGLSSINLADQYAYRRNWSDALQLYKTGYALIRQYGNQRQLPDDAAFKLANAFFYAGQLDSCRYYLQLTDMYRRRGRIREFGQDLEDEYVRLNYYDVARLYYRAVGNLPLAYQYLDSVTVLRERINKRYNADRVSLVNQKLLIQKHQLDVKHLQAEQKNQRLLFWLIGAGLMVLALFFFGLYYIGRIRRRQEQLINQEKEKSLQLEKRIVEEELLRAQANLNEFIDNLNQKTALLDAITAQLEASGQAPPAGPEATPLTDTQQYLHNASLLTNDDWDEFRRRFERVYPGFLSQLRTQFGLISPAEERLLTLSKLNINTRQMSRMLGISAESIRKTRYRLRKKLGTDGNSELSDLLG